MEQNKSPKDLVRSIISELETIKQVLYNAALTDPQRFAQMQDQIANGLDQNPMVQRLFSLLDQLDTE